MQEDTHVLDSLKVNSYPVGYSHTIFIDESIAESTYYRNVLNVLHSATENDTIKMIIDTNGGLGSTAMTLTHAMDGCKASITGVLSGNCKSAGTLIALHCHNWELGHGLDWMAHTASFGIGGEAHKVAQQHEHEQKLIRELLFREYEGFYTTEEIEEIAAGKDSYLTAEEVGERLEYLTVYRQDKADAYHQDLDDAMWDENNRIVDETLETLDISEEDKETFNRVRNLLDGALQEPIESKVKETVDDIIKSMKDTVEPLLTGSGNLHTVKVMNSNNTGCVGTLFYSLDDKNSPYEVELIYTNYGNEYILQVDEEFLDSSNRKDLIYVLECTTGLKSLSRWSTTNLINRFITDMFKLITKD